MLASYLRRAPFLILSLALAACAGPVATPTPPPATATAEPPTATPVPLAARVEGEPITLAAFEAEVQRFEAAQMELGTELATLNSYRERVLQALIDLTLLAQGAERAGVGLTPEQLSAKLDALASEAGGGEAMGTWLAANGYDTESFKQALRREALAAEMTARIVDGVPETAEQVHARHILVDSRERAQTLLEDLEAGGDFSQLAVEHSLDLSTRVDGGDLGWFPRGILTQPAVEEAAFNLEPGERSGVIESELGFHIIETLEREERPLRLNARRRLEKRAVQLWLEEARAGADIEILIDP